MKCTLVKNLYMKSKISKKLYINNVIKSVKEVASLMPFEFMIIILINVIFIAANRYGIIIYMTLFNKLTNGYIIKNVSSYDRYTYAINSLKVIFPAIIFYLSYEFLIKLKNTFFERYYLQFVILIKFQGKSKTKIQEKCKEIDSLMYLQNSIHEKIHEAEVASTNIFRITESVVDQLGLFINIIVISSIFLKINKAYLIIIFCATLPTFISSVLKGNNSLNYRKRINRIERKRNELRDSIIKPEYASENKVLDINEYLISKYEKFQNENSKLNINYLLSNYRVERIAATFMAIGYLLGYSLSIYLLIINKNIGDFLASIMAFNVIQNSVSNLIIYQGYVNMFSKMVEPYFNLIETKVENKLILKEEDKSFKSLELKDAFFKYPGSINKTLKNINIKINKGEKIAVVGLNGSGKTTISKLILGLYKVSEGKYLYNNIDIGKKLNLEPIYSNKSAVFQDFKRYPLSIKDNIGLSQIDENLNEDRIKSILNKIDFDIEKENIKLNENLGKELGYRDLSGGQWQKIAIARCIYKDSDFIVFDEPTSAIDPIFELNIYRAMDKMLKDKTGLIITHKLGSIKFVDKILVMDNGNISGFGTHYELLNSCDTYIKLWNASKESFIS